MKTYDITITRDGRWWMVAIPELDGLTQARRLSEAPRMAREWIALTTDATMEDVDVSITTIDVAGHDILVDRERIAELRQQVATMTERLSAMTRETARDLVKKDVPVRDVGEVLDVSPQRVSQLVNG